MIFGAVSYATVATSFDPYTWPNRVATGVPVAIAVVVVIRRGWLWRHLSVSIAPPRRALVVGTAVWVAVISLAVGLQLLMYFGSPRDLYPTLSSFAEEVFSIHALRAASFAAWLGLGWLLVAR